MNLAKLLSAGRSLGGLKDNGNRYRVTTQRLLPKFDSKKNPFGNGGTEVLSQCPQAAAEVIAPRQVEPTVVPVVPVLAKAAPRRSLVSRFRGWWAKPRKSQSPVSVPGVKSEEPLVQPELLLDSVRVMRNDLSDSDVEIVEAKPRAKVSEKTATADGKQPQTRWQQMAGKLFTAGKQ